MTRRDAAMCAQDHVIIAREGTICKSHRGGVNQCCRRRNRQKILAHTSLSAYIIKVAYGAERGKGAAAAAAAAAAVEIAESE